MMNRKLMVELLSDMGFREVYEYEGGMRGVPSWVYDLAESIIEAGWKK